MEKEHCASEAAGDAISWGRLLTLRQLQLKGPFGDGETIIS